MMYVFVRRTYPPPSLPHTSKSSRHFVQSSSKGSRRCLQRWNSKREASFASVTRSNSCNESTMYPKDRADESNYARYIGVERPPLANLEELLKSAEKLFDLSFSTACFPRCLMFARRFAGSNRDRGGVKIRK